MKKYPRKGEYGDSRPRCQWCGRTYDRSILDPLGENPYCSYECRMAGQFGLGVCLVVVFIPLAILATIYWPVLTIGFGALALFVPIIFWILVVWLLRGVQVGYRMRSRELS